MIVDLLKEVQAKLLDPRIDSLGLRLVRHFGSRWTNQSVDLQGRTFRVRITKERGIYEVWFAAADEAFDWFGYSEVFYVLNYNAPRLTTYDVHQTISRLRELLLVRGEAIASLFAPENYRHTFRQIVQARDAQAEEPGSPK